MASGQIINSGVGVTAGTTITFDHSCNVLMLKATSSGTVTINGKTFAIDAGSHMYDIIPCVAIDFTVVTGTIDYIALDQDS